MHRVRTFFEFANVISGLFYLIRITLFNYGIASIKLVDFYLKVLIQKNFKLYTGPRRILVFCCTAKLPYLSILKVTKEDFSQFSFKPRTKLPISSLYLRIIFYFYLILIIKESRSSSVQDYSFYIVYSQALNFPQFLFLSQKRSTRRCYCVTLSLSQNY